MKSKLSFPTPLHQQIAEMAQELFEPNPAVDTVLVVNSVARGEAIPESDLDMAVLVKPHVSAEEMKAMEASWTALKRGQSWDGHFKPVHLDVFDGRVTPTVWDDGGGPDMFEVEIGNRIAYSAPMNVAGEYFQELQKRWLPFYDEELRLKRLKMVLEACYYDLDHVTFFQGRGLHFQAFDRLYKAHQEFLQALFIARRTYPIAYNKWIREQVKTWLELPEVYRALSRLLSVRNIQSAELTNKAEKLRVLAKTYC